MVASENLSLVSLMSRCQRFHSTCASVTAVTATWDAIMLRSSPRARTIHSAVNKLLHRRGTVLSERARNPLSCSWMDTCVHLCVHAYVCPRTCVQHSFSVFADEKSQHKGNKGWMKGCVFCIIYFFSSHVSPNMAKFSSHSPDFHTRQGETE